MEEDTRQAEEEAEDEEVKSGVLEEYLEKVFSDIKSQIEHYTSPQCYRNGTFWIRPRDPVFGLQASQKTAAGLSPNVLYHLDVFVWIPHLLPGSPAGGFKFKCPDCGAGMILNGA